MLTMTRRGKFEEEIETNKRAQETKVKLMRNKLMMVI